MPLDPNVTKHHRPAEATSCPLPTCRRHLSTPAIYLPISGFGGLLFTTAFTIAAIYRVRSAGLDPFQLVLLGTALDGAIFLCEIPTGVVAGLVLSPALWLYRRAAKQRLLQPGASATSSSTTRIEEESMSEGCSSRVTRRGTTRRS